MFRKITMAAVPAMAFILTTFVADNSNSQAFAKGAARGGHSVGRNYRGGDGHFRHFDHYRYGYRGYGYFGYEAPVYETVAVEPVVAEPVVAEPVATVCTPYEATYVPVNTSYGSYWGGYRHYHNERGPGRIMGGRIMDGHVGGRGR